MSNVQYRFNDTTAYGIYNGLSEESISGLLRSKRQKYGVYISNLSKTLDAAQVARTLSKDQEIVDAATQTYQAYPVQEGWREEYKTWYAQAMVDKEAPGYGIVPLELLDRKIEAIVKTYREEMQPELDALAARTERFNEMKVTVLRQTKAIRYEDEESAIVLVLDPKTGESGEFKCRNIFDFGYVVNPNYALAPGRNPGGIVQENCWQVFSNNTWEIVRELTPFESKAVGYLQEFPPVPRGIRM